MASKTDKVSPFDLPFEEGIRFFRGKTNLPTEHWDDIVRETHDTAFMVAGAVQADLLTDLRGAIDKAAAQGTTIDQFRKDFDTTVAKNGWDYYGDRDWRTRIIFETNLRTAYQAGRYEQMKDPDLVRLRPFWEYQHGDSVKPRVMHESWSGLLLRHDDPWWETHYPPNGFNCKCRVTTLSKRDLEKTGRTGPDKAPDDGTYTWTDRDGDEHEIPNGIDPSWDYAPGKSLVDKTRDVVQQKMPTWPEPLQKEVAKTLEAAAQNKGEFVPAKTTKEAMQWAMKNNLADRVDYAGFHVGIANEVNRCLSEAFKKMPELRDNFEFVGSMQSAYKTWYDVSVRKYQQEILRLNPGLDVRIAEEAAKKNIKLRKVPGNTYACAFRKDWSPISGISFNKSRVKDFDQLSASMARDSATGWHPQDAGSVAGLVHHELGHKIDFMLKLSHDEEIKKLYDAWCVKNISGEGLSRYGRKNIQEFLAEAWSEHVASSTPRPLANQVGKIILSRYDSWKLTKKTVG